MQRLEGMLGVPIEMVDDGVTLLVVESGAEWPTWASRLSRRAHTNLVETEVLGETESEFEQRLFARLTRLREKRQPLLAAGYVASAASNRALLRERIGTALLRQMSSSGELILGGGFWLPKDGSSSEGTTMFQLWERLSELGAPQLISLRFNEDPDSSTGYAAPLGPSEYPAPALGEWR